MTTPPTPPRRSNPNAIVVVVAAASAVLLAILIVAVALKPDDAKSTAAAPMPTTRPIILPTAAPPPAATATQRAAAAPTTTGRSARCTAVPDQYLAMINASFSATGYSLANPWAVAGTRDRIWIGGNIVNGDKRISSADVWVANGPTVYSLSGGARRNSMLVDGRHLLDLSAGDDDGIAVQDCVTAR